MSKKYEFKVKVTFVCEDVSPMRGMDVELSVFGRDSYDAMRSILDSTKAFRAQGYDIVCAEILEKEELPRR